MRTAGIVAHVYRLLRAILVHVRYAKLARRPQEPHYLRYVSRICFYSLVDIPLKWLVSISNPLIVPVVPNLMIVLRQSSRTLSVARFSKCLPIMVMIVPTGFPAVVESTVRTELPFQTFCGLGHRKDVHKMEVKRNSTCRISPVGARGGKPLRRTRRIWR
jgi:hypothetical protein